MKITKSLMGQFPDGKNYQFRMERWQHICGDEMIDEIKINDLIDEVKSLHLPLISKMEIVERNNVFDPSLDNYLKIQYKIPFLYYLAIISSPHEERVEHINEIDHIFHEQAMSREVSSIDLDQCRNNSILDFHEVDSELADALLQRKIERRLRRAIERYGRPIQGEWDSCPHDQGMFHGSERGLGDRITIIQHLRPLIDPNQHDQHVIRQALELGLTFESYSVLLEEFYNDLLQKIQEIKSGNVDDPLCSQLIKIYDRDHDRFS